MDDLTVIITEFGFAISLAVGMGYFIYNKLLIGCIMIIISLISAYTTNYIMSNK